MMASDVIGAEKHAWFCTGGKFKVRYKTGKHTTNNFTILEMVSGFGMRNIYELYTPQSNIYLMTFLFFWGFFCYIYSD